MIVAETMEIRDAERKPRAGDMEWQIQLMVDTQFPKATWHE